LPTNAHFSSNWTSRVWGGKSDEFVVDLAGVLASHHRQANDRILVDSHQATGLADPTILLKVVQHGHRLVVGQFAAIEGSALAFAEAVLAGPAS
jgi:hypothetical protein